MKPKKGIHDLKPFIVMPLLSSPGYVVLSMSTSVNVAVQRATGGQRAQWNWHDCICRPCVCNKYMKQWHANCKGRRLLVSSCLYLDLELSARLRLTLLNSALCRAETSNNEIHFLVHHSRDFFNLEVFNVLWGGCCVTPADTGLIPSAP